MHVRSHETMDNTSCARTYHVCARAIWAFTTLGLIWEPWRPGQLATRHVGRPRTLQQMPGEVHHHMQEGDKLDRQPPQPRICITSWPFGEDQVSWYQSPEELPFASSLQSYTSTGKTRQFPSILSFRAGMTAQWSIFAPRRTLQIEPCKEDDLDALSISNAFGDKRHNIAGLQALISGKVYDITLHHEETAKSFAAIGLDIDSSHYELRLMSATTTHVSVLHQLNSPPKLCSPGFRNMGTLISPKPHI